MAAGRESVLFGDFSQYTIYSTPSLQSLHRFDNDRALVKAGQIGFLIDTFVGGNAIVPEAFATYQNAA